MLDCRCTCGGPMLNWQWTCGGPMLDWRWACGGPMLECVWACCGSGYHSPTYILYLLTEQFVGRRMEECLDRLRPKTKLKIYDLQERNMLWTHA